MVASAPPRCPAVRGRSRAAVLGLAAGLLVAGAALPAPATGQSLAVHGVVPPQRPAANVPADPPFVGVCAGLAGAGAACEQAAVAALDRARRREGLGPLVIPGTFPRLSPAEQLFVLVDEERVSRGLAPFLGLTAGLDAIAGEAARAGTDPVPSVGSLGGDAAQAWSGNWAEGPGPLGISYGWMYDDGYGSGNLACARPSAPACWGHRDNILARWAPGPNRWLVMGAAATGGRGLASATESMVLLRGRRPALVYSWSEAVRAGC